MSRNETAGAAERARMGIQFFAEGEPGGIADAAPLEGAGLGGVNGNIGDPGPQGPSGPEDAPLPEGISVEYTADDPLEAIFAGESDGEDAFAAEESDDGKPVEPQPPVAEEQTFAVQLGGETVQMTAAQMAEQLAAAQPPSQEQLQAIVQQQLIQNPAMQLIERKAANSGMTVEQYVAAMEQQERTREVQQIMQQTGLSQEMASELAESRRFRQQMENERAEQAAQQQAKETRNSMFTNFMQSFPAVKAENVPSEVWQSVENGMDLTAAYALHRVGELERENAALKQNAHARQKSIGSASGVEQTGGRDPVLDGLNGISY